MVDDQLWQRLAAEAEQRCSTHGPSHDFLHVVRVVANADHLLAHEGGNPDVVRLAALLHELVSLPKDHPDSSRSGDWAANAALRVLEQVGVDRDTARQSADCIRFHSFSRGVLPATHEARLLQDADRLDAIGAVGIARCFATCAQIGRPLWASCDPFCRERAPDDREFGLDHFYNKLLRIPALLHTPTARAMAGARLEAMQQFLSALEQELTCHERAAADC
jgi:uncharacterized protein